MINTDLIKELETPIELDRNIVKKQGFKSLLGIVLATAISGAAIWYMHKDDIEQAEQHKEVLDVEYVDDTGSVIPKHLVESSDGTHILDIDKEPYVDYKTKKKRTSNDRSRSKTSTDRRRRTSTDDRRRNDSRK